MNQFIQMQMQMRNRQDDCYEYDDDEKCEDTRHDYAYDSAYTQYYND